MWFTQFFQGIADLLTTAVNAVSGYRTFFGGSNDDVLFGSNQNDIMYGRDGKDWLVAKDGNDILYGGANDDRLVGGGGENTLYGGGGSDDFVVSILDTGGGRTEIADFDPRRDKLVIEYSAAEPTGVEAATELATDAMRGFERSNIGGSGDAVFFIGKHLIVLEDYFDDYDVGDMRGIDVELALLG